MAENKTSAGGSNTPAENTNKNPLRVLVDWVTCSFQLDVTASEIFHLLGISELENLDTKIGARYEFAGYDITYTLGNIELMHDQEENQWLLNMSGQGCRQYEILSSMDMVTMFAMLDNLQATYTRLDIAIDDFSNIFDVNTIRKSVYNKQCVTRLSDWGTAKRGKIATGNDSLTMDNFYLGNSSSRYFLNVYDKKLERIARDKPLEKDENGEDVTSWTRTEIRFKYEYANLFVQHILRDDKPIGYHIKSFLNEKIQFLTKSALSKDTNKSRLAKDKENICKWWKKFLNGAGKLRLTVYRPEKTLDDSKLWLENQVSTTLGMLAIYEPMKYIDMVDRLTLLGIEKMKKKHLQKVQDQHILDFMQNRQGIWIKNDNNKNEKADRKIDKKKYMEKLKDSYWQQVKEQQKSQPLEMTDSQTN